MPAEGLNPKCCVAGSQTCSTGRAAAATQQLSYVTGDWSFPLKYLKKHRSEKEGIIFLLFFNLLVLCDVNVGLSGLGGGWVWKGWQSVF